MYAYLGREDSNVHLSTGNREILEASYFLLELEIRSMVDEWEYGGSLSSSREAVI